MQVIFWPLVAHASAHNIIARPQIIENLLSPAWLHRARRARTSTNWNDTSTASGSFCHARFILNVASASGVRVYALAFVLEAGIF